MIELFVRSAVVDNMALVFFLGISTLLGGSRRVSTALGLGIAIVVVMGVTVFHGVTTGRSGLRCHVFLSRNMFTQLGVN